MQPLALIVAMSVPGRVIGRGGTLPWHFPEDMRFFRRTTTGHSVVMGRKTYESVGKPLPNRRCIVVSRSPGLVLEGCEVTPTLEEALDLARTTDPEPMVIGGGEIYRAALPLATRIYLTEVARDVSGDAFFPELDANVWREVERRPGEAPELRFVTLERIGIPGSPRP